MNRISASRGFQSRVKGVVQRVELLAFCCVLVLSLSGCRTWSSREQKAAKAYYQGNELRKQGYFAEAEEAYREAISQEKDFTPATFNLALVLAETDRWAESLDLLDSLREKDPRNLIVLRAMGWVSFLAGDYSSSLDYYQLALTIFEADEESLRSVAQVYELLGEFQSALVYRRVLLRLNEDSGSRIALAQNLIQIGSNSEALDLYRLVLTDEPKNVEALEAAAGLAEQAGMYKEAVRYYLKLAEILPLLPLKAATDIGYAKIEPPGASNSPIVKSESSGAKNRGRESALWRAAHIFLVEIGDYTSGMDSLRNALEAGYSDPAAFDELLRLIPSTIRPTVRQMLSGR